MSRETARHHIMAVWRLGLHRAMCYEYFSVAGHIKGASISTVCVQYNGIFSMNEASIVGWGGRKTDRSRTLEIYTKSAYVLSCQNSID
jgi:hypothetical protein